MWVPGMQEVVGQQVGHIAGREPPVKHLLLGQVTAAGKDDRVVVVRYG